MLNKATRAIDGKDYSSAFTIFSRLAKAGNVEAQDRLGDMHRYGQGVNKNGIEAARWYRLAVEQGYASPLMKLGEMYENGEGIMKSVKQAVHLV